MITQHGPQCDVCGTYILPGFSESINPFGMAGIKGTLLAHDSLTRDMDLIAVPWVKRCVKPKTLGLRIEKAICKYPGSLKMHLKAVRENVGKKPHGRIAISIYIGPEMYIDLSVFPRR